MGDDDGRDDAAVDHADGDRPCAAPAGRRERGRLAAIGVSAAFVAGYLVTWAAAGLLGYAIFDAVSSLDLGFPPGMTRALHLRRRDPRRRALPADRAEGRVPAPLPQPGDAPRALPSRRLGALRMGIEHGGICVGCCWALMAALFALGVMSIAWMAFVAALIAAERLLPWRGPPAPSPSCSRCWGSRSRSRRRRSRASRSRARRTRRG